MRKQHDDQNEELDSIAEMEKVNMRNFKRMLLLPFEIGILKALSIIGLVVLANMGIDRLLMWIQIYTGPPEMANTGWLAIGLMAVMAVTFTVISGSVLGIPVTRGEQTLPRAMRIVIGTLQAAFVLLTLGVYLVVVRGGQ